MGVRSFIKRNSFIIILTAIFLTLSIATYLIHYLVFHDVHHIFIYLVGDLAFLPIEVLLVVVIIERILTRMETQAKIQKLNMVIGAFFNEIGNHMLQSLLEYFRNKAEISLHLNVSDEWTRIDFQKARDFAYHLTVDIDYKNLDLNQLRKFLSDRRDFLLTILENPSLLENDRFTDLLWAITHLSEELMARPSLDNLPDSDLLHLSGDIQRMYDHLASEWLDYVEHLKSKYPYLFSLIVRTHPFQERPSPIVS